MCPCGRAQGMRMSCRLLCGLEQPSTFHVWWSREFHCGMQTEWVGGRVGVRMLRQCVPTVWRLPHGGRFLLCLAVQLCGAASQAVRARSRSFHASVLSVQGSAAVAQSRSAGVNGSTHQVLARRRLAGALPVCASDLQRCFSSSLSEGPALVVVCGGWDLICTGLWLRMLGVMCVRGPRASCTCICLHGHPWQPCFR